MMIVALASGIANWIADAADALHAVRFVRPLALWLVLVPLPLGLAMWHAQRLQAKRLAALGRLQPVLPRYPWLRRVLLALAWVLLVVATARPRWGLTPSASVAVGRDLVIVLDFSRSMLAEDMLAAATPARWQVAVASVDRLLADFRMRRTGHRVAVILFAARPMLLVPLTTDFEHVRFRLAELDAAVPPAEIRPADDQAISGTRIGAALQLAIATHDSRFPGVQDVLLMTDGDDPGGDREWQRGITAARQARIPVHVVGLGDPSQDSFLLREGQPLEAIGPGGVPTPIQTRLDVAPARAIAEETGGEWLAAERSTPDLANWYRTRIEPAGVREVSDERLPEFQDRTAWFVAPAVILLVLAWGFEQARAEPKPNTSRA